MLKEARNRYTLSGDRLQEYLAAKNEIQCSMYVQIVAFPRSYPNWVAFHKPMPYSPKKKKKSETQEKHFK